MEELYECGEDSFLILKHIKHFAEGRRVLDMGTGSGILAEEAAKYASVVVAADINPKAIVKAGEISGVQAVQSNLFKNIRGKFDLVLFNAPYLPDEGGTKTTDGGPKGNEVIERFLKDLKPHLAKDGCVLLVFSSLTPNVDELIILNGFTFTLLEQQKLFFEELFLYEVRA